MAGTISLSLSQQFDQLGRPLSNGLLYFIQAGTTSTPQNAYFDTALTLPLPNPVTLDASGRIPAFYLADGQIKVRLTDKYGVSQLEQDNLLVVGPSSGGGGGGGGGTVDPTTVFQTGDVLWLPMQGTRAGWTRANGRTIGSVSSGASERANADTSALFSYLWNNFSNTICPVSTGRGANAAADFAANKTITLLDWRGYVPGGLDDMGNSAAGRYANVPVVSGSVTAAGSILGANTNTLITANLPPYTPTGTIPDHKHDIRGGTGAVVNQAGFNVPASPASNAAWDSSGATRFGETNNTSLAFTGTAQGGTSTAFGNVQKTVLGTFFLKL